MDKKSLKKIKIEGTDAIRFANRLREIVGKENLQIEIAVILKCRRNAKLSYEQIENIMNTEPYHVSIKK